MATISTGLDAVLRSYGASAGTVTITHQDHRIMKTITFNWTSTAGGAVEAQTTDVISGQILRVVHIPGTGATQPTNNYDSVVEDSDGLDVLQGTGANVSNASPTDFFPALTNGTNGNSIPPAVDSKLTLEIINVGNAKTGSTVLYYR